MSGSAPDLKLRLLGGILRAYARTKLRGQTRLTLLLARNLKCLQGVAINVADWPPIYMDMRSLSAHSWFLGTPFDRSPLEVSEQAVMRRFVRPGDVVFDIGANMGLHTMMLAQLVGPQGRVVAFEPNSELLPMLERTLEALPNVTLYSCALSDESRDSVLFVPEDHSMASLADWTSGGTTGSRRATGSARTHTLRCQERRMDELLSADGILSPDFIKCDVEGAELLTFKGGRNTLDRPDAPIILFEANTNTAGGFDLNRSDAADFLGGLPQAGYRFLEVGEGGALRPVRPSEFKAANILAVPQAKSDLCPELKETGPGRVGAATGPSRETA
jgi:FkbM family methyltransferase